MAETLRKKKKSRDQLMMEIMLEAMNAQDQGGGSPMGQMAPGLTTAPDFPVGMHYGGEPFNASEMINNYLEEYPDSTSKAREEMIKDFPVIRAQMIGTGKFDEDKFIQLLNELIARRHMASRNLRK